MTDGVARGIWISIRRTTYSNGPRAPAVSAQGQDAHLQSQTSDNTSSEQLKEDIAKMRWLIRRNARGARCNRLGRLTEADNESDSDGDLSSSEEEQGEYDLSDSQIKKKVIERVKQKIAEHNYQETYKSCERVAEKAEEKWSLGTGYFALVKVYETDQHLKDWVNIFNFNLYWLLIVSI